SDRPLRQAWCASAQARKLFPTPVAPNPVFGQVALDYRFAPELCWPRAGQQKGAVDNLVGGVKKSFFTCRRFHDRADLEQQLRDWLRMVIRHPRRAAAASLLPEHRAAMLDAVRGARGRLYFQRQSLWELGRPAEAW